MNYRFPRVARTWVLLLLVLTAVSLPIQLAATPPSGSTVALLGTPTYVTGSSSITSYTVPAGANRLLIVTTSYADDGGVNDFTGVTYGGQVMTRVPGAIKGDGGSALDSIWYLVLGTSASSTNGQISASLPSGSYPTAFLSAQAFQYVDQSTPVSAGMGVNNPGSNSGSTNTLSSAANDLVLDLFDVFGSGSTMTAVLNSGQTSLNQINSFNIGTVASYGGAESYGTSTKPGASSVSIGWTAANGAMIHLAMNIKYGAAAVTPTISSVTGPANGSYRAGQTLSFTANFSAAVTVTGTPQLPLTIGSSSVSASYASGSGTTALVFSYTVQAGDTDSDGIASTSPLVLNGGTIKSSGGTDATLTFTPPTTTSVLVDTTAPTISIGAPSASLTAGGSVSYTITYTDANFNSSTLANGNVTLNKTGTANGTVNVTGSGTTRTVTISSITGDGSLGISIASGTASDVAGNTASSAGPSTTFAVDNTAPTISIGSPSVSTTAGGSVTYTITYADVNFNSSTLANGNVTLNKTGTANGTVNVTGTGTTRTVTISSITGDGTLGISIASGTASDLAGNAAPSAGPSTTFAVDNTAPTIAIGSSSASITKGGPVTYTVTYGDANFNTATLANGDVTLNKTGTANGTVDVTGTGTTRTVTISSITGDGSLGISIASGTASDNSGNTAPAAGPSTTFLVDNTAPTVDIGSPSVSTTSTGPVTFLVTYSDANFNAVTLVPGDITLNTTGTATGTVGVSGTGNTRTVTISGITGTGTLAFSIASGTASDLAGNLAPSGALCTTVTVQNAPVVTTEAATAITLTSATLNATINPNGLATTAAFYSGPDTNYGTTNGVTLSPDNSTTNQEVNVNLTGLTPATTYHYLAIATNSVGVTSGLDLTFTTATNLSAPTAINLSNSSVAENQPSGTVVGNLTDTDSDVGDTATFTLVSGTGSTDNASFQIVANQLQTAASFDFETKNSYSIRIQVTDAGGLTFEQAFPISISNVNEPPVFSGYSLTAAKNTQASILAAKLLAKTTDPEGDTRTISSVGATSDQGGTVTFTGSLVKYTPPTGYTGPDSFSVVFTDGSLTTTGFVTVSVGVPAGSGPALISITTVGSDVQLKFSGIPGHQYDIQRSTSLTAPVTWNTLTTVTANASGFILYTDSSPPSPSYWRTLNNP